SEICQQVEAGVARGALRPGDALPTVRALAAASGVSAATVAAAYRRLVERGVVTSHGRHGTRVAGRPPLPVADPAVPAHAVDLASGNPDPALLPPLAPVLRRLSGRHRLYGEA